ncbi:hypothetical protein GTPT_2646 [Tatumella ptyseos ATCC 33301]|uniref:Thioredoxin-like fold domain-containing protein n=2 Tax=Tatumella ptyseos TaxID=82987 RepID=A0A085JDB0_9GAMM|nr:hypothetical protein GTPT_2646 [Tatumella ptyseos ATCC 33301]SQK74322.1 Uncharacterised protein [Tatumella ptyseos]
MVASPLSEKALTLGHGPALLEVFLEPTCPFSVRAFNKLAGLVSLAGEEQLSVRIYLQSQPWHMFSGVIVRCILAAKTLPEGNAAALKIMQAVGEHREEFEFEDHCRGPNMTATPQQIIERIEKYSGIRVSDAFDKPELQQLIKWHCKYSRQNGIHVSPTFMINGLIQADMGSGEEISQWAERIRNA